jgi:hypothetical protein
VYNPTKLGPDIEIMDHGLAIERNWNMSYLLDDVARTLASPTTPRRQSLKLLGALLAGGILGAVGVGRAVAQDEAVCGANCRDSSECPLNYRCDTCRSKPRRMHCIPK